MDLSGRCTAELAERPKHPVASYRGPGFRPEAFLGAESVIPLGSVTSARWDARSDRTYVFDAVRGEVVVFSNKGQVSLRFGGKGEGPGEFSPNALNAGTSRYPFSQLAFLGEDGVLVHDQGGTLHRFDLEGKFFDRFPVSEEMADRHGLRHLDPWTEGSVLYDRTGFLHSLDVDRAGMLALYALPSRDAPNTPQPLGYLRNHRSLLSDPTLPSPFDGAYRRIWGSLAEGVLATISLDAYGVCFLDGDGEPMSSFRVDVEDTPFGARERAEYLARRGPPPPMSGGRSWDDFYPDFPEFFPRYADLVLAPDSTAWIERWIDPDRREWDLFHVEGGYLGTLQPFAARLPIGFNGRCAMVVEEAAAEGLASNDEERFGIRLWCP